MVLTACSSTDHAHPILTRYSSDGAIGIFISLTSSAWTSFVRHVMEGIGSNGVEMVRSSIIRADHINY